MPGFVLGLYEYDPDGRKAGVLEDTIGIKVIRHSMFFYFFPHLKTSNFYTNFVYAIG